MPALQAHVQAEAQTLPMSLCWPRAKLFTCPLGSRATRRSTCLLPQHVLAACWLSASCLLSLWDPSLPPSLPSLPSLPSSHAQRQTERQRAGVEQTCVTAKEVRQPPRSLFISPRPATHTTYPRARAPKMSAAVWHVWHVCEWRSVHVCKWHTRSEAPASRRWQAAPPCRGATVLHTHPPRDLRGRR